jgi:hypothetical protein
MRELLTYLHQRIHWGPQAMCDAVLQVWVYRIYTLAKQVSEDCLTCQKINKQALKQRPAGGRNPRL